MLALLVNKIYDILEPKLKKLVQDAVAEAVKDISAEVESLPGKIVDGLVSRVPTIGNILKGLF